MELAVFEAVGGAFRRGAARGCGGGLNEEMVQFSVFDFQVSIFFVSLLDCILCPAGCKCLKYSK